jgi:GntR family transcriptional repressor for pyruvate dehydrogenase complex
MLRPIQTTSLINEVIEQLRKVIIDGVYKPGDRLPSEKELCKQLGVSRTAIREAKKALIGMGLIESSRGQGTFVRDNILDTLMQSIRLDLLMEQGSIGELIDARRVIEVESAGMAAERSTDEDIDNLRNLIDRMRIAVKEENQEAFQEYDLAWHSAIVEATQNKYLVTMSLAIRNLLEVFISDVLQVSGSDVIALTRHEQITEAIAIGDGEQAKSAMSKHLEEVRKIGLTRIEKINNHSQ